RSFFFFFLLINQIKIFKICNKLAVHFFFFFFFFFFFLSLNFRMKNKHTKAHVLSHVRPILAKNDNSLSIKFK
ncbi:MAG: hypothetical protein J8272_02000, partial ['Prunus persica' phytoplasma PP2]|nr:hypothetical protein ['Prunus persica' phytoplasma PP2]